VNLPKRLNDRIKELNIIALMQAGSQVYGTDIPGKSDIDLKGVFLPNKEQIYLGRIPRNISLTTKKNKDDKNTPEDIDVELFSLHEYIKLACNGQTIAIDMLHTPEDMIIEKSAIWDKIVANRPKFYTKNLNAFVQYARRQASRYCLRGSRLGTIERVLNLLKEESLLAKLSIEKRLRDVWSNLPKLEHTRKYVDEKTGLRMYEVCGRKFPETAKLDYIIPILQKFKDNYGQRAEDAKNNKNIDWKAISHAVRAAIEVKQILTEGTITFPLKEAEYLRDIKQGKLHYQNEVAPDLEGRMEELEDLAEKSTLPNSVDRLFWDKFIIDTIEDYYYINYY